MSSMKKPIVWIGVIVLVVILGGAGAFAAHQWRHKSASTTTSQTTHTAKKHSTQHTVSLANCAVHDLDATLDGTGGGTAGSIYEKLILTNNGTTACTLDGFPKAQLVASDGSIVGSVADNDTSDGNGTSLTIQPNGTVHATLRFVQNNFDSGVCKDGATGLAVYAPGDTIALSISTTQTTWCPGFSVTALTQ